MTNEELRRKSGRDMEFNRQQSGRDMEFNRQQSGRNMEEARRASGRKMRDDMRALAENNRAERTLTVLPVRGSQPARRGSALFSGGSSAPASGGGIASPLTEDPATRTYHAGSAVTVYPADGFFFYSVLSVKSLTFKDAKNGTVKFNLEPPEYMV